MYKNFLRSADAPSTQGCFENGLTLKQAFVKSETIEPKISVSKEIIADYFEETFGKDVICKRRENFTKPGRGMEIGLPLADTHYKKINGKRVCFMYVYEMGKTTFLLIKTNEETALEIKKLHPGIGTSNYPRSPKHDWYAMIIDESFGSEDELKLILSTIYNQHFDVDMYKKMTSAANIAKANKLISDEDLEDYIEESEVKVSKTGKEAIINVDTLCEHFDDKAEINMDILKKMELIPKDAKRVKILARGVLTKSFVVTADAYSSDAAKMIVALGGRVIIG